MSVGQKKVCTAVPPFGVDQEKIRNAVTMLLEAIGEDPQREGLQDTPARVARMYQEIFKGLHENPHHHCNTVFSEAHEEVVFVRDIQFFSMCEHHLVPFHGKAHVGYLPQSGRVVGLSKLARVVESVSRRPQLQERMTSMVADVIVEQLQPQGVVVMVEAEHFCMSMRGVRNPGSTTVTMARRGSFKTDLDPEVLQLLMAR